MSGNSNESKLYAALGVSSSKEGVHKALGAAVEAQPAQFFAQVHDDVLGDSAYYSLLHADGAGTKSIIAYLAFRETKDPSWFRSLAQDSLVMNLDDVACVGAFENLMLSNTIGRNRHLVPDAAIAEIIAGYKQLAGQLEELGIPLTLAGGETADVGDIVRTLIVDSTLFARVPRSRAISTAAIAAGDVIIGIQGTGRTIYEREDNSGMGSNGFTLARHALISKKYCDKYPEILDPRIDPGLAYRGMHDLFETPAPLTMPVVKALMSPTRMYAPILKTIFAALPGQIHGAIHCSGGGQTKILRFGHNKHYVKDALFECLPVYRLVQSTLAVPWDEMYSVFNMGHRMELVCSEQHLPVIKEIVARFGIEARRIGYVAEGNGHNTLAIKSEFGEFFYD